MLAEMLGVRGACSRTGVFLVVFAVVCLCLGLDVFRSVRFSRLHMRPEVLGSGFV